MIITITGDPGSGKSTIANALHALLQITYYDIGLIRRDLAKQKNMTLEEYNKYGKAHHETDTEVDTYQRQLGEQEDNFVIVGRLSYYFIPHSIKIFIAVDEDVGAKRIAQDLSDAKRNKLRNETTHATTDSHAVKELIKKRQENDAERYRTIYGINPSNRSHYDLVIDSTDKTPRTVLFDIFSYLHQNGYINETPESLLVRARDNESIIKQQVLK